MNSGNESSHKFLSNIILWVMIIPQSVLVALNVQGWGLIQGEASDQETTVALLFLISELTILIICCLFFWLQKTGRIQVGWKTALFSLVVHASYLWCSLIYLRYAIPDSIQPWILEAGSVGRWNITLFMPGAFLSLYALTRIGFNSINQIWATPLAIAGILGMPLVWYLSAALLQPAWFGQIHVVVSILVATLGVLIFLASVVQLFDKVLHIPFSGKPAEQHYWIAAILGLAAPLGGLWLNQYISFPTDLQSTSIYLFTVINGLILMLKTDSARHSSMRFFLRCLTFPFIAYFFLVFLPFLPLSIFAILAVGAGFLMLTPLALGLFQARVTLDEYRLSTSQVGRTKATSIGIIGLSILPSYFVLDAALDKRALDTSLDYFYSHDISGEPLSKSDIRRSSQALIQLRDRKLGVQLPYIAGFYNRVVFGDMVLSDTKVARIHKLLTGTEIPKPRASLLGIGESGRGNFRAGRVLAPQQDVRISNAEVFANGEHKTTVRLTMENLSQNTHSLFVEKLDIPEGVFISGLRLKIDGKWESGKIFDRKTALWVFQKITEVRRDPALLFYNSLKQAELRVYPFPKKGTREVEIDFQFHPSIDAKVSIGQNVVDLNPGFNSASITLIDGSTLIAEDISSMAFHRAPYVHFILDRSNLSRSAVEDEAKAITKILAELDIDEYRITAANINSSDIDSKELLDSTDSKTIIEYIDQIKLEKMGGLWVQQAIAREILRINEDEHRPMFNRVPVFVVISDQEKTLEENFSLDAWSWLAPDISGWYRYDFDELKWIKQKHKQPDSFTPSQVVAIKHEGQVSIYPADESSIFPHSVLEELSVYNTATKQFVPRSVHNDLQASSDWAEMAQLWSSWKTTNTNPSLIEQNRQEFLTLSRSKNVLLPGTSLIVVESPSQWEILKRKEKQALNNHSGLDFEEEQQTSEPSWWVLLIGLLIFLYFRERKLITSKRIGA